MTQNNLKQYVRLGIDLKRIEEKISALENNLYNPRTQKFSDMPKGSGRMDLEDKVAKLLELRTFYLKRLGDLILQRLEIEKAISNLNDPLERAVLGYKYIDGMSWEDVCYKINYEHRQTHRIHSKALAHLNMA